MIYDEKEPGVFVLYSMKEMKEATRFETDPFFIVHMINAYDDPNEENTVTGSTNLDLMVHFHDMGHMILSIS